MNTPVPYEIGPGYRKGGIVLVGRDPGSEEVRAGRPFVGVSGRLLDDCLREAGLRRQDLAILNTVRYQPHGNDFSRHDRALVEREVRHLLATLEDLAPRLVVALGNEAAFAATGGEWPSRDGTIFTATGIEERRGYLWDTPHGWTVLTTVHPALAARTWVPWRMLLSWDLQKAKEQHAHGHLRRPERTVELVTDDHAARSAVACLRRAGRVAADIEIADSQRLLCIGFADRSDRAFVFPATYLDQARELLEDSRLTIIWQNGQFDLHFLLTRYDLRVAAQLEDTLLAWHACYPELAGKKVSGSGSKRTHKSLAFFASLFTTDAWWKDYETDETGMMILNGRDCCVTYDVFTNHLEPMVRQQGVQRIYRHEVGLIWPVVEMQARGMRVDDAERKRRIQALTQRLDEYRSRINEIVVPLLEARWDKIPEQQRRLFEQVEGVCPCCRHSPKKQLRCWSCAGFDKAPSKQDLVQRVGAENAKVSKEQLETMVLDVCKVCGGAPRRRWLEFNPDSVDQKKIVLYDLLKLPVRMKDGKPTTDEEALKSLVGYVS